jgi:hypothetical protein
MPANPPMIIKERNEELMNILMILVKEKLTIRTTGRNIGGMRMILSDSVRKVMIKKVKNIRKKNRKKRKIRRNQKKNRRKTNDDVIVDDIVYCYQ